MFMAVVPGLLISADHLPALLHTNLFAQPPFISGFSPRLVRICAETMTL